MKSILGRELAVLVANSEIREVDMDVEGLPANGGENPLEKPEADKLSPFRRVTKFEIPGKSPNEIHYSRLEEIAHKVVLVEEKLQDLNDKTLKQEHDVLVLKRDLEKLRGVAETIALMSRQITNMYFAFARAVGRHEADKIFKVEI
jgi:hypothetical protein